MKPSITLIHPSRGRAKKAIETAKRWAGKWSGDISFQYILSIDKSDQKKGEYFQEYFSCIEMVCLGENNSVVEATNRAARRASGDVLVYVSDDFDCPQDWDRLIMSSIDLDEPQLIKVDDCLQPFDVKVLTIPIMNRALYDKLGYFWHPEYKSMFVDEDLYHTCANNGWLKMCPELKFPHNHVSIGKAEDDETYRRSAANWDQGKEVFARRKAAGFPL